MFTYSHGGAAAAERSEVVKGAEVEIKDKTSKAGVAPGTAEEDKEKDALRDMSVLATVEDFQEADSAHDEKRMLDGIFARSVNSAYDHEQIVNGPQKAKADMAVLRREADQVARKAAAHLRTSREEARHVPIGTVTWTGEVGQGGRPGGNRRRGGPSSSGIMSNLADRQGLENGSSSRSRSGTPGADRNLKAKDFMLLIKTFINRHGGKVPSKMLVDHFNPYCPGKKQSDEFKQALDTIAVLQKAGGAGRGMWSLKPGIK